MSDVEFRERIPWLRDADARADDYRPPRVRAADREVLVSPAMNEIEAPNEPRAGMSSAGVTINLRKLEELLTPNPLVEIAMLINRLTYGEMIELAEAMWKTHTGGLAITEGSLPALLHRWCKSHLAVAEGDSQERVSA